MEFDEKADVLRGRDHRRQAKKAIRIRMHLLFHNIRSHKTFLLLSEPL